MPLSQSKRYFANPAQARQHDKQDGGVGKVEESKKESSDAHEPGDMQHGEAHKIEIHKLHDGSYHQVAHHADGSHATHHPTLEHAHEHQKDAFDDGGGDRDVSDNMGDEEEGPEAKGFLNTFK
jgi:hypothetical protein